VTLYISDLDGTLLDSAGGLSAFSRDGLNNLIDSGCLFTVASARSVVSMQRILEGLRLRLPVIEFNGACISDPATGAHLIANTLDWDIAEEVTRIAESIDLHPFHSTISDGRDNLFPAAMHNPGTEWYINDREYHRDPRMQRLPFDPGQKRFHDLVCLTYIESEYRMTELEAALSDASSVAGSVAINRFENHYSPGWHWLTVHDVRAKKHIAARQLAEQFAPDAEELVAFGDNLNDLSLFAASDRCYAVLDAVDRVKNVATGIIGSNDEDAVVRKIMKERRTPNA
jgi:HAD superfamily hydrolase (TIGR01484 family)